MAGSSDNKQKLLSRILLGVVVLALSGGMLLYLVPTGPVACTGASSDVVAKVGDQTVTLDEIRQQLDQIKQRNQVPPMLVPYYTQQILHQLLLQKEMQYEGDPPRHPRLE